MNESSDFALRAYSYTSSIHPDCEGDGFRSHTVVGGAWQGMDSMISEKEMPVEPLRKGKPG